MEFDYAHSLIISLLPKRVWDVCQRRNGYRITPMKGLIEPSNEIVCSAQSELWGLCTGIPVQIPRIPCGYDTRKCRPQAKGRRSDQPTMAMAYQLQGKFNINMLFELRKKSQLAFCLLLFMISSLHKTGSIFLGFCLSNLLTGKSHNLVEQFGLHRHFPRPLHHLGHSPRTRLRGFY